MGESTPATAKPAAKKRAARKPKPAPASSGVSVEAPNGDTIDPALLGTSRGERTYYPAVPLALIEEEPDFNPRTTFDQDALDELAASIVLHGLNDPLQLRPIPGNPPSGKPQFYLTGGHRRFRASKMAGLKQVPAFVNLSGDALVAAALDNSLRVDLDPLEEAKLYARFMAEKGLTVRGVAEVMSVAQRRVTERLRILEMPEVGQQAVAEGKLPMRDVAFYADIAQKSVLMATTLCAADVAHDGGLTGYQMNEVIMQTEGLAHPRQIEAGTKYFKLAKPDVKQAIEDLAQEAGDPGYGARRSWLVHTARREGLLGASLHHSNGKLRVELPEEALEEGQKIGTVVRFKTGHDVVEAITDLKWLQATIEELLPKTVEAMAKVKKTTGGGASSLGGGMAEDEKARRAAEREKDKIDREKAKESNAQLGVALAKHLAVVDPMDPDAIAAVCKMLLSPYVSSYYSETGKDVSLLSAGGLRFLWPEWKNEVTSKGNNPKVRVVLENDRQKLADRFWLWFDEATTPAQMLGKTLQVFAAIHYADHNEQMSKDRIGAAQSLPGHPDVAKHIERLFDKHAPATRRKNKSGGKSTPKQAAKPAPEAVDENVEVTDDERLVMIALHEGSYGCNSEADVKRKLAEATGISARLCGGALNSLRSKNLIAGVRAAPYLPDRAKELAGVMVAAEKLAKDKAAEVEAKAVAAA